jgi:thiamine pyrophosphate-dependent acetolactate synthase large subunit-like protein
VGLWGDAAATLRRLVSLMEQGEPQSAWRDLQGRKQELQARLERKATAATRPIKPQFAVRALQEAVPADAVICLDTGDNALFMCQQYQPKGERFVSSYHLGSTGYALPAALGAAVAFPERAVVAVAGDGGLAFSLGELITAVQHNLPVTVVCLNNARLGMINSEQEQLGMAPFFTERPAIDYASVAQACGAQGVHVEEPGALTATLHQALGARRPFVVDVAIDPMERQSTALEPVEVGVRV